ncbi:hypothetical protein J6590_001529 [Homalodisca vitripennis]|nr:hypothetical protein J6590_001529 [Homalodisca vitripennis]
MIVAAMSPATQGPGMSAQPRIIVTRLLPPPTFQRPLLPEGSRRPPVSGQRAYKMSPTRTPFPKTTPPKRSVRNQQIG